MISNKLSAYPNKTEYLLLTQNFLNNPNCNVNIERDIITLNDSARNLEVIFQSDLSIE